MRPLHRLAATAAAFTMLAGVPAAGSAPAAATELSSAGPIVFQSTETALPGQVVGALGTGFGTAPDLRLTVVDGSEAQVVPEQSLQLLARSDRVAHGVVPAGLPVGLYAVAVSGSDPVFVNRAKGANLDFGELSPGYPFRIFGRNLLLPGATPTVRFVAPDGTSLAATVMAQGSDQYELRATAPAAIVPGITYRLFVSNGYGGSHGETRVARDVTAVAGGPGPGHDPFGIRTPWATDFVSIAANVYDVTSDRRLSVRATPNDALDDTLAIQRAMDSASAAGGGTVQLPAGEYLLTEGLGGAPATALTMRTGVVLQGAGQALTTLRMRGVSGGGQSVKLPGGTHRAGFADLTLAATNVIGNSWNLNEQGYDVRKLFIVRNTWTTDTRGNIRWVGSFASGVGTSEVGCSMAPDSCWRYLAVRDSEFHATGTTGTGLVSNFYFVNWRDAVLSGNRLSHKGGRYFVNDNLNITVEDNHVTYAKDDGGQSDGGYGGFWADYTQHSQFLRNTVVAPKPYAFSNDGEALAFEGYSHDSQGAHDGPLLGSGASSATFAAQKTPGSLTAADGFRGWTIAVLNGPGAGQFREIVGSSYDGASARYTVTVDRPWDVTPAPGTNYSVVLAGKNFLAKGNYFEGVPRPIWIYNSSHRDLTITDNTVVNGEAIQLRTDNRENNNGDGFHVFENPYAVGNTVVRDEREKRGLPCYLSYRTATLRYPSLGTHLFLPELRDNTVRCTRPSADTRGVTDPPGTQNDGFWVYAQDRTLGDLDMPYRGGQETAISGAIVDGNSASSVDNAYTIGTGVADTSIWRSTHSDDVGQMLRDDLGHQATTSAAGTYGPDGQPIEPKTGAGGPGGGFTASSTEHPATGAERAFDGKRDTQWQAQTGAGPHWVEAQLPAARTFDRVIITSYTNDTAGGQRVRAATISVADSDGELAEVGSFSDNSEMDREVVLAEPVTTDRIRVTVTDYSVAGVPGYPTAVIAEVTTALGGSPPPPPPPAPDNYSASSQYPIGNYAPANAFDGSTSTMWYPSESTAPRPHWLQVGFAEQQRVAGVVVRGRRDNADINTHIDVFTSASGGELTLAGQAVDATEKDTQIDFAEPVDADALRVSMVRTVNTSGQEVPGSGVSELELILAPAGPTVGAVTVTGGSVEGDRVTASAPVSGSSTCSVYFGDGTTVKADVVDGVCGADHVYLDDGRYDVVVNAGTAMSSAAVDITNAAPVVARPVISTSDKRNIAVSATFTDAGTADTHTCRVDWGDGTASQGTVSGKTCDGGQHAYRKKGTYRVTVSVTDDEGAVGRSSAQHTG